MPSYVEFRDLSAVFAAANGIGTAAGELSRALGAQIPSLRSGEAAALRSRDVYGEPFWTNTYAAATDGVARNENVYDNAKKVDETVANIGPDVTEAATQLVWQDALAAQAMAQGNA